MIFLCHDVFNTTRPNWRDPSQITISDTKKNVTKLIGREGPYFIKEHSDSKNKYTEEDIVNMLEFLVDNIFVVFGERFSNR